jgi:hypothetical protein
MGGYSVKSQVKVLAEDSHIDWHMIFDVKLRENYRRKAWLVACGHKIGVPLISRELI